MSLFGREQGVRYARKHLAGYAIHAGIPAQDPRHRALVTAENPDTVVRDVARLFDEAPLEMAA